MSEPTPPSAPPTTRELLADTRHRELVAEIREQGAILAEIRTGIGTLVALEQRRVQQADVEITAATDRRRLELEASTARWRWATQALQSRTAAGLAGAAATPLGLALARWLGVDLAALVAPPSAP